jgi:hypothetical protein
VPIKRCSLHRVSLMEIDSAPRYSLCVPHMRQRPDPTIPVDGVQIVRASRGGGPDSLGRCT